MHHTATHNIGLGSYNDDFNRLMKDLLMMDHFGKGFIRTDYYRRMVHGCHSKKKKIYKVIIIN